MLDMGEPVKIVDLAQDMISLSGLQVGRDIDIVFTGLRPGEKLFEEMFAAGEQYERTEHQKIYTAANASTFVPRGLDEAIADLERAAECNDRAAIVRSLQDLIPEYCPTQVATTIAPVQDDRAATTDLPEWHSYGVKPSSSAV